MRSNVGVLIHGCHLHAEAWHNIVWGNPHGYRGRAPKGIAQALRHNASLIYWGTGASQKDGLNESQYTFNYALEHLVDFVKGRTESADEVAAYLHEVSLIDTVTQNTTEEIKAALDECHKRNIQELYLVSSPTHIARCHQEALKVLAATSNAHQVLVYATASDTCFANSTPNDVVIVEPPHRGDRPKFPVHKHIRGIFAVPPSNMPGFLREFDSLVERHKP